MRSRATGIPLNLVLDQESHCFLVEENTGTPAAEWEPPISDEALDAARDALQSKESYPLSTAIEWQFDGEEEYCLQFFPDGQAFGLPIQFQIGSQQFQFDIDRLSGNAQVMELNAR